MYVTTNTETLFIEQGVTMLTKRALVKEYGPYCLPVLEKGEYIEQLPRMKGEQPKFKMLKNLPTKEEYPAMQQAHYSETVEEIYESAKSEIESLQEEMESWADNMESTSLASTSKCSEVREAADSLSGLNWPDAPEQWPEWRALRLPDLSGRTGRAHRAGVAAGELTIVSEALTAYTDTLKVKDPQRQELEEFAEAINDVVSDVESVDFPGMY
jgi:hypothetical protein